MSMVNATVSHDIRNPLNAIHCQNIVLKMLVERVGELIDEKDMPLEFKLVLTRIHKRMNDALEINSSGEKLISFLVNDFLDLG